MNWSIKKNEWANLLKDYYSINEAKRLLSLIAIELFPHYSSTAFTLNTVDLSQKEVKQMEQAITKLKAHLPYQYIINKTWFMDFSLYVNENVLIPRPETEELVALILSTNKNIAPKILDIGTGSGCIPLALKKTLNKADVHAIDYCEKALEVAKKNAKQLDLNITFHHLDILDEATWGSLPKFDIIVSNPPYIPYSEKELMGASVLKYEPKLALFVKDNNPLLFYDKISDFAQNHLMLSGKLFFECNEFNIKDVALLLKDKSFTNIKIHTDLQGKERMISASL